MVSSRNLLQCAQIALLEHTVAQALTSVQYAIWAIIPLNQIVPAQLARQGHLRYQQALLLSVILALLESPAQQVQQLVHFVLQGNMQTR